MSIHLPVQQGSYEWHMCRMGLLTASAVKRLLTPKKLGVSKSGVASLASELIAERAMMQPLEVDLAGFAERGTMLEQEAVPWYEMQMDTTVSRDGFYFDPLLMVGGSPDGLTPNAGLEIKSLSPAKHLRMIMEDSPAEYMAQIQMCMWLCDRETWDLLFYHPSMPSKIITIARDKSYLVLLRCAVDTLQEAMNGMTEHLEATGLDFGAWRIHIEKLARGEFPRQEMLEPTCPNMWQV